MPIHGSWKSMAGGMRKTYCKKGEKQVPREFADGTSLRMCAKAWSVFFATLRKNKWSESKPRPRKINETVFNEAVEEHVEGIRVWFAETLAGKVVKKSG